MQGPVSNGTVTLGDSVLAPDKTTWTVYGFDGKTPLIYRGPLQAVLETDTVQKSRPLLYEPGSYVLMQRSPEQRDNRFLVVANRQVHDQWEMACYPIATPDYVVWLPPQVIYSVEMWYSELGRPDPLPFVINFPRRNLYLLPAKLDKLRKDQPFQEESWMRATVKPSGSQVSTPVIAAGVVGLLLVLDNN